MNFLLILFFLSIPKSFSTPTELYELENPSSREKSWSLSIDHSYSRRLSYNSSDSLSHSLSASYLFKGKLFRLSSSYSQPLSDFVSDTSFYGWADTSLSIQNPLPFAKTFLGMKSGHSLGLSFPTSLSSRRAKKYASLYGVFYYLKSYSSLRFTFDHLFYSEFYKYQSNISGSIPNQLVSTAHTVALSWSYKKITTRASARFYLYSYLADLDPNPEVKDTTLRFKGGQGGSLSLTYKLPYSISIYGQSSLNVPIVSRLLTGFPLFDYKNISYFFGLNWHL